MPRTGRPTTRATDANPAPQKGRAMSRKGTNPPPPMPSMKPPAPPQPPHAEPVAMLTCYGEGDAAVYELCGIHPAIASVPSGKRRLYTWLYTHPPGPEAQSVLDLLAVLHRDGGHYTAEHGVEKSAADAMAEVLRLKQFDSA